MTTYELVETNEDINALGASASIFSLVVTGTEGPQGPQGPSGEVDTAISPQPTYTGDILTRVDYADGSYKLLTYTNELLTQVDYVRTGFPTIRKTLSYINGIWDGTVETEI
jgi:hypothetical protein